MKVINERIKNISYQVFSWAFLGQPIDGLLFNFWIWVSPSSSFLFGESFIHNTLLNLSEHFEEVVSELFLFPDSSLIHDLLFWDGLESLKNLIFQVWLSLVVVTLAEFVRALKQAIFLEKLLIDMMFILTEDQGHKLFGVFPGVFEDLPHFLS